MAVDTTLTLKADSRDLTAKLNEANRLIAELTREIEKLKAAGENTTGLEKDLQKLKDAAYDSEQALKNNREELARRRQEELNAAKATRENTNEQKGFFGALVGGAGVIKGAIGTIFAFKEAYARTRETIRFFKEQFGIDIDEMVTKSLALDTIAERITGLGDKAKLAADDQQRLVNMINVLDNLGIKHAGTIEDVTKKYDEWVKSHRKVIEATEEHDAAFDKFAKKVTGFSAKELVAELEDIARVQKEMESRGLSDNVVWSDAQRERIAKATAAVNTYGAALEKELGPEAAAKVRALAEEMQGFDLASADAAKSQLDLAVETKKTVDQLDKELDKLRGLRAEIDGVGADVLRITGDIRTKFAEAAEDSGSGIESIRAQIAALAQEEEKLSRAFHTTEAQEIRRQEIAAERADLERELIEEQRKGAGVFELSIKDQIEIQSKFRDALAAAEKQIQSWPESARGAMQAVIDRFQFLNDEVEVSERDVKDFEIAFKGAMAAAGQATTRLETKLQIDLNAAREAYKAFGEEAVAAYSLINQESAAFTNELKSQLELVKELTKGLQEMAA